jgi:hypothetical protein
VAGEKPARGWAGKRTPKRVSAGAGPETMPPASERWYVDVDPWAVLLEQLTEVPEDEPVQRKAGKEE